MSSRSLLLLSLLSLPALAEPSRVFPLGLAADEPVASRFLWENAPSLADERAAIQRSRARIAEAGVRPNPELDFEVGTLPVGETNPPGLRPLADVPNYSVGLSWPFELGKRGPRREAALRDAEATVLDARQALRDAGLELRKLAATVASAQARDALLESLQADARRLSELEERRLGIGASTGVEVDRARVEEEALVLERIEVAEALDEALVACSALVGTPCEPFESDEAATAFLRAVPALPDAFDPERPELQAFDARRKAREAERTLALNQALPDPTVRVAYVHDRFQAGDNQRHSFNVGVSVPLPILDAGRASARVFEADIGEASMGKERLGRARRAEMDALRRRALQLARQVEHIESTAAPLARSVVERLERALPKGGGSASELVQARRALVELEQGALELRLALHAARADLAHVAGTSADSSATLLSEKESP